MISLTEEEWATLHATPAFNRLINQLDRECKTVQELMGEGGLLDADNPPRTAMNYAVNVGRVAALREVVDYRPDYREEETDGGQ